MALYFVTNAQVGLALADGDVLHMTQTGSYFALGADASLIAEGGATMFVAGSVLGDDAAIKLSHTNGANAANLLTISATGAVHGLIAGIRSSDQYGEIQNFGQITGGVNGVEYSAPTAWSSNTLRNFGTITGINGVLVQNNEATYADVVLINDGTIMAANYAFVSLDSDSADTIINRGLMEGSVETNGYGDYLDNRGVITGGITLGAGADTLINRFAPAGTLSADLGDDNDTAYLGWAEEAVYGGEGFDTVSYRGQGAVRINLTDQDDNFGAAGGDSLNSFEVFEGSVTGRDTLIGDDEGQSFYGLAGRDEIRGGGGDDGLIGGLGADKLTGGLGNDTFFFSRPLDGGDIITDFSDASGNSDQIIISLAGFTLGLASGMLGAAAFQSGAGHVALTNAVRFIWDTNDNTLWFDRDGAKTVLDPVLLADLQASAVLTQADIFLT